VIPARFAKEDALGHNGIGGETETLESQPGSNEHL
jgi:hypothetical protein